MRRIIGLLTVAAMLAVLSVVMAAPALANADEHASCPGAAHSNQQPLGADTTGDLTDLAKCDF